MKKGSAILTIILIIVPFGLIIGAAIWIWQRNQPTRVISVEYLDPQKPQIATVNVAINNKPVTVELSPDWRGQNIDGHLVDAEYGDPSPVYPFLEQLKKICIYEQPSGKLITCKKL